MDKLLLKVILRESECPNICLALKQQVTFLFFLHSLLEDGFQTPVKFLMVYTGINTDQNVLLSIKPFLQLWPVMMKSCDPWEDKV